MRERENEREGGGKRVEEGAERGEGERMQERYRNENKTGEKEG